MDGEIPMDIIYEICLHSLEVYRVVITHRKFHEYMGVGGRLFKLQNAHTVRDGIKYTLCGRPHRFDGPAEIGVLGTIWWYRYGRYHREDGPAIISYTKNKWWYRDGKRHRVDGPAVICADNEYWYQDDRLHRDSSGGETDGGERGDPGPAVIRHDGSKEWWRNGILIRRSPS